MKLKSMLLALLCAFATFSLIPAHAQSWSAPTMPTVSDEIAHVTQDDEVYSYYIQNVGTGQFLTAANNWGTQISVGDNDEPYMQFAVFHVTSGEYVPYVFRNGSYVYDRSLNALGTGWIMRMNGEYTSGNSSYSNLSLGYSLLFRDSESNGFVDLNSQGNGYLWNLIDTGNGSYYIQTIEEDSKFPSAASQYAAAFSPGGGVDFSNTVQDEYSQWRFFAATGDSPMNRYAARLNLYEVLNQAWNAGVSTKTASSIYNNSNSTVDQLNAAAEQLRNDISSNGLADVIANASSTNPVDITQYAIVNPDFDDGMSPWVFDGTMGNNQQIQGARYENNGIVIQNFIEAWRSPGYGPLNNGLIYQTVNGLPAGRYRLECDAIAVWQAGDYAISEQVGAFLFVYDNGTSNLFHATLSTGNGAPEHFTLSFNLTETTSVNLGLMTEGTNINWIAGDNFRLIYYGNEGSDLDYLAATLAEEVAAAQALQGQIPSGAWTRLSTTISLKNRSYTTVDAYNAAIADLRAARLEAQTLVEPYAAYREVVAQVEAIDEHSSNAWVALNLTMSTTNSTVNANNVTADDITQATTELQSALATYYINQGGNDVDVTSTFIVNPSPYENANGWETPYGAPNVFDPTNRCAEFWNMQGAVLQQTIHNLPAGNYTLTAIAFTRTGFNATLFAGDKSIALTTVDQSVVNMRSTANMWFNQGNGVNRLNFTMAAKGDITIGIKAATEGDGWTTWRSFTLTTGHSGEEGRVIGDTFTTTSPEGATLTFTVTSSSTCALTSATFVNGLTVPAQADGLAVTEIGEAVFQGFEYTSINLPTSIVKIDKSAFRSSKITAFPNLPNLEFIGSYAFYGCTGLAGIDLDLPETLTELGTYAFFGISSFTTITSRNPTPPTAQSNAFSSAIYKSTPLYVPESCKAAYQNAQCWGGFTTISDGGSEGLSDGDTFMYTYQNVTLEYTVLSTEAMTCSLTAGTGAQTIVIPETALDFTVTTIGKSAFRSMTSIKSVTLPSKLETIDSYAFYGCSGLTTINLPASVKTIETYAFFGCSGLTSVIVNSTTPPTATTSTFSSTTYTNAALELKKGGLATYSATAPWSSFKNIKDNTATILTVVVEGQGTITYTDKSGKTFTAKQGSTTFTLDSTVVVLHVAPATGYRFKKAVYVSTSGEKDYTSRVKDDGSMQMGVYVKSSTLTFTFEKKSIKLDLIREGEGTVKINNKTVTFDEDGFSEDNDVSNETAIKLTMTPASGYRLDRVTLKGEDITSRVDGNNVLDLTNELTDGEYRLKIVFAEGVSNFAFDGLTYGVPDPSKQEVRLEARSYDISDITIPDKVEKDGVTYTVTSVDDRAFADNGTLRCVTFPSTIKTIGKNLFDNCKNLAAIVWNATQVFPDEAIGDFFNPNLLFYTINNSQAPKNKVPYVINYQKDTGKYACNQKIVLKDAKTYGSFHCPIAFTAPNIEYTHEYLMETKPGTAQGWETLVLPFDVKKIRHNKIMKNIVPYATTSEEEVIKGVHPFWLYEYTTEKWKEATEIKAYTPYIISMPNYKTYPEDYQMSGEVTFLADNVEIQPTSDAAVTSGDFTFHTNFQSRENPAFYLLNVQNALVKYDGTKAAGSAFMQQTALDRPVLPFECYFTTTSSAVKELFGIFEDVTDAIPDLPADLASKRAATGVYDLSGRKVNDDTTLRRGLYIVNGRKVLVR